ncbi:MAG: hypothetical protein HC868_14525 [Sphingomonadales bacterium]|nr:hypothetical protein [Sphingomonadales bacterium]
MDELQVKEPASPLLEPTAVDRFLIARGGPFYELQQRLGLLHENALQTGKRALLAVGLAWGIPLVLSLATGHAWGPVVTRPFLLDPGAWARFLLAVAIFVLMEGMVEERLRGLLRQLVRAPLVAPASMAAGAAAVIRAIDQRDNAVAEAVILVLAVLISVSAAMTHLRAPDASWFIAVDAAGDGDLTLAGWWTVLIGAPLFWFLMLRWLWRHLLWALLLRDLARLDLRLVASHPDGMGGIGFIGKYPNIFSLFVFALSGVVAAALARGLLTGGLSIAVFPKVMGIWLLVVFVLFAVPLTAFMGPLSRLKQATMLACSARATRYQRAVEREMLETNIMAPDPAEAETTQPVPDPAKLYASAVKLQTFPISKAVLLPLGAAALLPLVAAGATQMPFKELLKIAKGLLL